MGLTAQSLPHLELQEHYTVLKELGSGTYGNVLLVEHQERGEASASQPGKGEVLSVLCSNGGALLHSQGSLQGFGAGPRGLYSRAQGGHSRR